MNFLPAEWLVGGAGEGVRLAVRPEHITLVPTHAARVHGRVLYAEPLGAETLVHLKLSDGGLLTVRQDGGAERPAEGAEIGLAWDEGRQMLFGPDGRRLPHGRAA